MAAPPKVETVVGRLSAAGYLAADEEANELLAEAPDASTLEVWIRRREAGEPLAWITGSMRFCESTLSVDPGLYVPRFQSERLARRAAALLAGAGSAVDLCTGVGAIAAHLMAEAPAATVIGTDIDWRAVVCARRNGVHAVLGDLDQPLRPRAFDLVTAVAPYVPTEKLRLLPRDVQRYEPGIALDGGPDGLEILRRVVVSAGRLLRPGGWLVIELGGSQDQAMSPTLAASGFDPATPWFDDDGELRGLAARSSRPTRDTCASSRRRGGP